VKDHIAELIVIGFKKDTKRALQALNQLQKMKEGWALDLRDGVAVSRDNKGKLRINQSYRTTAHQGARRGVVWGSLIGAILATPFTGGTSATFAAEALAAGALGGGALAGAGGALDAAWWKDEFGIPDEFIKQVGSMIQLGDSAILSFVGLVTLTPWRTSFVVVEAPSFVPP
jgi:uncharacterized membrane protein